MTLHKYIRHSKLGFILWPKEDDLWHMHVGQMLLKQTLGTIVSAGFVTFEREGPVCHGRSESLRIQSLPEDTALLRKQMEVG
jgi:hypothetical protein